MRTKPKSIKASDTKPPQSVLAIPAPVDVAAAEKADDGSSRPARFTAVFYTGGLLEINGWDLPVAIDLSGLTEGNVLVANLDHDKTKRVGNFEVQNDGQTLTAYGTATASTSARDEVINSAKDGYQWQASLEVRPKAVEKLEAGVTAEVNGQTIEGPAYITRQGVLKGFAFVSHGADDDTSVSIAATAATLTKEKTMDPKLKAFIEAELPGVDVATLPETAIASLRARHAEKETTIVTEPAKNLDQIIAGKQADVERRNAIVEIAAKACDVHPFAMEKIKQLAEQAMDGEWTVDKFRLELMEASTPMAHTQFNVRNHENGRISTKVLEAAVCMAGRLEGHEKLFDDQTLQTAHDRFRTNIGLKQLFVLAAEANGYKPLGYDVTIDVQRAAFNMVGQREIRAAGGFSTLSLPQLLSNVANKFLRQGWDAVDSTWSRISKVRPVNDFKTITTISLTGDLQFDKVGPGGELHHATLGEEVYSNKADTYGRMMAITRTDLINDDLGALTDVPKRLGRGGALKLNDIFWKKFLDNSTFFTSARGNVSTDTGALSLLGLEQAETKFMLQTDPDGKPLGVMPKILLVPTALKATGSTLMTSERVVTGENATRGDHNIFRGRFQLESSPYMQNSAYTGFSAIAWYLLADPNEMPVIEIAALYGRVEPVIESADADFNTLGVQMRGYSDIGVELQEYRGGVRADGSTAG